MSNGPYSYLSSYFQDEVLNQISTDDTMSAWLRHLESCQFEPVTKCGAGLSDRLQWRRSLSPKVRKFP